MLDDWQTVWTTTGCHILQCLIWVYMYIVCSDLSVRIIRVSVLEPIVPDKAHFFSWVLIFLHQGDGKKLSTSGKNSIWYVRCISMSDNIIDIKHEWCSVREFWPVICGTVNSIHFAWIPSSGSSTRTGGVTVLKILTCKCNLETTMIFLQWNIHHAYFN